MRIAKEDSLVLVVDVQEKLVPHMYDQEAAVAKMTTLVRGAKTLDIPVIAARQYPQGLGDIVMPLRLQLSEIHDKMTFSCCGDASFMDAIRSKGKKNVIVIGVETHVCVLQTAIDLKAAGFAVIVAADAVASRFQRDYEIALKRMEQEGILLTTTESVLFELCRQAGSETFKTISKLVK